jgi:4-hydroxy-tetrahydrodipicolinate reductase
MSASANIKIGLTGASGRMGQMIASLIPDADDLTVVAATDRAESPMMAQPLSRDHDVPISSDIDAAVTAADVMIDFTQPEAILAHVEAARAAGTAIVIGTTGLSASDEAILSAAAKDTPIVYCANTSVGVTLLGKVVEDVARQLGADWDIEIVETHHNQKVDAPSGTALALGHAAAAGRGVDLEDVRDSGRDGITGKRKEGDIGFAVMRGGDVAGEHSVIFYGQQERVEITHRATSRVIFARGALRAARFAVQQKPGLYSMQDVLDG